MTEIRLCAFADEASPLLSEQIKELNKHNIPYLELRGVNGKNVADCTVEEAKEWKKELDAGNIKVWSIGSPIGKVTMDKPFEEHLAKAENIFKIANVLECKNVRVFSFFTDKHEENRDEILRRMNSLCELADKYGVTLCHENEKEIYGDIAVRCKDILDNTPALKSVFDPANYVQCKQSIPQALDLLQSSTYYYHIKDAFYKDGAVVPAGCGDGMIELMVSGIDKDAVLTLEPHLTVFSGYSSIDNTQLLHKFTYSSASDAFAAAVEAIKNILKKLGYKETGKSWKK